MPALNKGPFNNYSKNVQGNDAGTYMWRLNRHHVIQTYADLPVRPNGVSGYPRLPGQEGRQ